MAKRRKKHTNKPRKNRTMSSGGRKSPRRKKAQRKGFLSEIGLADSTNKLTLGQSLKKTIGASIGGGAGILVHKLAPTSWGKLVRVGGAFVISTGLAYFGMPSTGAGYMGATIALNFQNGLMADGYADENALADAPLFVDDNGNAMVLEEGEDGTSGYRYLSEEEVAMLSEQGAFAEYEVVS